MLVKHTVGLFEQRDEQILSHAHLEGLSPYDYGLIGIANHQPEVMAHAFENDTHIYIQHTNMLKDFFFLADIELACERMNALFYQKQSRLRCVRLNGTDTSPVFVVEEPRQEIFNHSGFGQLYFFSEGVPAMAFSTLSDSLTERYGVLRTHQALMTKYLYISGTRSNGTDGQLRMLLKGLLGEQHIIDIGVLPKGAQSRFNISTRLPSGLSFDALRAVLPHMVYDYEAEDDVTDLAGGRLEILLLQQDIESLLLNKELSIELNNWGRRETQPAEMDAHFNLTIHLMTSALKSCRIAYTSNACMAERHIVSHLAASIGLHYEEGIFELGGQWISIGYEHVDGTAQLYVIHRLEADKPHVVAVEQPHEVPIMQGWRELEWGQASALVIGFEKHYIHQIRDRMSLVTTRLVSARVDEQPKIVFVRRASSKCDLQDVRIHRVDAWDINSYLNVTEDRCQGFDNHSSWRMSRMLRRHPEQLIEVHLYPYASRPAYVLQETPLTNMGTVLE